MKLCLIQTQSLNEYFIVINDTIHKIHNVQTTHNSNRILFYFNTETYQILVLATENGTLTALTSPLLRAQKGLSCLHFNYHIRVQNHVDYGLTVSSVKENGEKKRLWAMSRQDYDIWESAQIQIKRDAPIKVCNENFSVSLLKFFFNHSRYLIADIF
jgi:hypothetical protein